MRNKKMFARLLAVAMCSTLVITTPIMTYATETTPIITPQAQADENGFVIEEGVLVDYVGTDTEIEIPDTVTSIQPDAFEDCTTLTKVTIPSSVMMIDFIMEDTINIFEDCDENLTIYCEYDTEAYLYARIVGINYTITDADENGLVIRTNTYPVYDEEGNETGSFETYVELVGYVGTAEEVVVPEGVERIYGVFGNCTELKKVTLPQSLTALLENTFFNCYNLEEVNIPDNVKTMDAYTFHGCHSLKNIKIPEGIEYIPAEIFNGCNSLTEIQLPDSTKWIGYWAFAYCSSLTEVVIPDGVVLIDNGAFMGCENLTKIVIPASVTQFEFDDNLEGVFENSPNVTIYGEEGSAAQQYAEDNDIPFVVLGSEDNTGSGDNNTGSGDDNTGSGDDNTGSGDNNTGSGDNNTGSGDNNTGSGDNNTSSGNNNTGSGDNNTGSGNNNIGSGDNNTDKSPTTGDNGVAWFYVMLFTGTSVVILTKVNNKKIVR